MSRLRINSLIFMLIAVILLPAFGLSASAADKVDNLSDVAGILSNSFIVCANSPVAYVNGTKAEIPAESLPYLSGNTTMLPLEYSVSKVNMQCTVNQGSFVLAGGGYSISGSAGTASVTVNGSISALPAAPETKNGSIFVPPAIFALAQKQVYAGSSGLVTIGTVAVTSSNEARLLGLMGVYVSPAGSDSNTGAPLSPVATLDKARDLVRLIKNSTGISSYGITVFIHGGTYRLSSTFSLTSADSGMNGAPVTYRKFGDGEVSIRGSMALDPASFSLVTDSAVLSRLPVEARGKVMQYQLPFAAQGYTPPSGPMSVETSYYELYSNSNLQTLARWPNGDYTLTGQIIDTGATTQKPAFKFLESRQLRWANASYALMMGYWGNDWACQPLPVQSIDMALRIVTLAKTPAYTILQGMRYYTFNLIEELDMPGEWYIDKASSILYYYPTQDFNSSSMELSTGTSELIKADGVSCLNFEGITVEYNRSTGVFFNNSSNCTISGSKIRHIGQMGVKINGGSNVTVKSCEINDIGGIGVYVNGGTRITLTPGNHRVENNHIYNFSRLYRTYAPGIDVFGVGQTIAHNILHDCPHFAMRFSGNDHIIEYNEIYNAVRETRDAGSIYCGRDWTMRGTEIRYNYIHDILSNVSTGTGTDAEAVYIDDMYSGVKIFGNVIVRANRASLIGGGRDNEFSNNIIVDCNRGVYYDDRGKYGAWAHSSTLPGGSLYNSLISIITNPSYDGTLWSTRYPKIPPLIDEVNAQAADPTNPAKDAGLPKGAIIKNNVFCGSATSKSGYESFAQGVSAYGTVSGNWKTTASDVGFVNPSAQNYELNSNSIVYTNVPDFQPIPFSSIGMLTDQWRTSIEAPVMNTTAIYPYDGEKVCANNVELVWSKAEGADRYHITLSRSPDLSNPIASVDTGAARYKLASLTEGTYYWQVQSFNTSKQIGASSVSAVFSFTVDSNICFDFNDQPDKTALEDIPGWQVQYTNKSIGDAVEISGGAVKITKSSALSNSNIMLTCKNPITTTGRIAVEYKVKFESNTQGADEFPSLDGIKDGATIADVHKATVQSNVYQTRYGASSNAIIASGVSSQPQRWYSVKYITDTKNDKFDVYLDNKLLSAATNLSLSSDVDYLGDLTFKISTIAVGASAGIYWLDDIKIYPVDKLEPLSFTIPNGTNLKSVQRYGIFSVDFNGALKSSTVNTNNVILTRDNVPADITVSLVNSRSIRINIISVLESRSKYTLRLLPAIESDDGIPIGKEYTYEFTTVQPVTITTLPTITDTGGLPIDTLAPSITAQVGVQLNNTSPSQALPLKLVVALKDTKGFVRKIVLQDATLAAGGSSLIQVPISLPAQTAANWRIYCYVFDGVSNINPLYNGIIQLP